MILAVFLLSGVLSPVLRGEIIRLRNGVELQCEILECSEERGLKVRRLDNGGVFDLRWEHILEVDAKAIKYARGYSDEEAKPIMVRAKRVVLRNGTYEDGIQVESDRPGTFCLRRKGKRYYFLQPEVDKIQNVDLEAKDVYTLEELYRKKLEESPPETVNEYFALGVYLESVTYYEKALELYQQVCKLDPEFKPDVIAQKVRVMTAKIEEKDATEYIDAIKGLIYRHRFALALERILAFDEKFPDSMQKGYLEKLKSETLVKRSAHYQQKILTDYFTYMDRAAHKIASNDAITLEDALQFAAEEMGPAIRQKLADDVYKISIEEVEEIWENRKRGAPRTASYGTGTFILGPDRAKTLPDLSGEEAEKKAEEKKEVKTLDERIKKRIEDIKKQKAKLRGKRKSKVRMDDIGRSPEEWWASESISNRKRFLIAFYAEESGDMRIQRVRLNPCIHCAGKGYLERMATAGSEDQKEPCEVCKTLGIERTVVFH